MSVDNTSIVNVSVKYQEDFCPFNCSQLSYTKIKRMVEKQVTCRRNDLLESTFVVPERENNFQQALLSADTNKERSFIKKVNTLKHTCFFEEKS